MALAKCRECGKEVSTGAKTCPGCGVATPAKPKSIGLVKGLIGLLFVGYLGSKLLQPQPSNTEASTTTSTMAAQPQSISSEGKDQDNPWSNLSEQDLRAALAADYLVMIQKEKRHLNYIDTSLRKQKGGFALYAVHDFFTKYTLSAGSEAKAITSWIDKNSLWLKKAKITRVGVWGTGEYASGAWYDLK